MPSDRPNVVKASGFCSLLIIYLSKDGSVKWDKTIGDYELVNNPAIAYIRSQKDGQIYLRGHIAPKNPAEGKDPEYHYWEGWINSQGKLTRKTGAVIIRENKEWQKNSARGKGSKIARG
jgi:hypothetical protein